MSHSWVAIRDPRIQGRCRRTVESAGAGREGTKVARSLGIRVFLRIVLVTLTFAFLRIGIWSLSMAATGEASWAQRGLLAPFLFATISLLMIGATFGRPPTLTRSEKFMAQIEQRSRPKKSRHMSVVFELLTSTMIVGLFIWSLHF